MPIPSMDQTGKVIVVTGARRGLGRQFALTFAEAGADAAISDMEAGDGLLEQTADEIRALGRRAITVQTDVTSKAQVDEMVARVLDDFGRIDILINNAGIAHSANILDISEEEWDLMMGTHMKGNLFCTQAVSKTMIEQGSARDRQPRLNRSEDEGRQSVRHRQEGHRPDELRDSESF